MSFLIGLVLGLLLGAPLATLGFVAWLAYRMFWHPAPRGR